MEEILLDPHHSIYLKILNPDCFDTFTPTTDLLD